MVHETSAWSPKAVLWTPPEIVSSTFASAPVPPAVLRFPSLVVGLQPGGLQTSWPQLGVMARNRTRPRAHVATGASTFMEASMRQMIPAKNEEPRRSTWESSGAEVSEDALSR